MVRHILLFIALLILITGCNNSMNGKVDSQKLHETINKSTNEQESGKQKSVFTNGIANDKTHSKGSEKDNVNLDNHLVKDSDGAEASKTHKQKLYQVNSSDWRIEPITDANKKIVLLTIDDAPDRYSIEMAQILHDLKVKAIFFVNGHFLDSEEEEHVLKEIYQMGHVIGNHTMTHRNLSDLSNEEQESEIINLNDLVEKIIGERPQFFRAPFGVITDVSRTIAAKEGMVLMNWTYGYDWESEYRSKEALTNIMVNSPFLKNGANLLLHDREWTKEALSQIVDGLRSKGFEIVDPNLIQVTSE